MSRSWANASASESASANTTTGAETAAADPAEATDSAEVEDNTEPLATVTVDDAERLENVAESLGVPVYRNFLRRAANGTLAAAHRDRALAQFALVEGDDPFTTFRDRKEAGESLHRVEAWNSTLGGHGRNIRYTRGRLIAGTFPVPSGGSETVPEGVGMVSDPSD